jgi:hypothetical protein
MTGVSLDRLQCPTCGELFSRDVVYETPEPIFTNSLTPYDIIAPGPAHIVCAAGHRWTIKSVTRSLDRPDEVLLGVFLGTVSADSR